MATTQNIRYAVKVLEEGGVIAYPTEGVFGLGCLPGDVDAVARILEMKRRDPEMGLVVIISDPAQLEDWTDLPPSELKLDSSDENPVTWIVPATEAVPPWIRGRHTSVAVRQTTHPVARALCAAAGSPIVSTSANVSGRPPVRNALVLRRVFGAKVDYVVPGDCGPAAGPSEIRDIRTGKVLRGA